MCVCVRTGFLCFPVVQLQSYCIQRCLVGNLLCQDCDSHYGVGAACRDVNGQIETWDFLVELGLLYNISYLSLSVAISKHYVFSRWHAKHFESFALHVKVLKMYITILSCATSAAAVWTSLRPKFWNPDLKLQGGGKPWKKIFCPPIDLTWGLFSICVLVLHRNLMCENLAPAVHASPLPCMSGPTSFSARQSWPLCWF